MLASCSGVRRRCSTSGASVSAAAGNAEARSGGCGCSRAGARVAGILAGVEIRVSSEKSFRHSDIAAVCNFQCNLDKIIFRFIDTFLM